MKDTLSLKNKKKRKDALPACIGRGMLLAILLLMLCLLLAAYLACRQDDPAAKVLPYSYIAMLLCMFLGGFFAARRRGRQGLICGALTGIGLLSLFLIGFLIFSGDSDIAGGRLFLSYLLFFAMSLLGGVAGGMLPAGRARRVRPKRH